MTQPTFNTRPSLYMRIPIAISAFFRILSDPEFAGRVSYYHQNNEQMPSPKSANLTAEGDGQIITETVSTYTPPVMTPVPAKAVTHDAALQLLSLLQREARLIDFTQEDLSSYSDADVGGAARVVHEGCCKVLREHFSIAPVRPETEGSRITLASGFDARAVRLTGNVVGSAPFSGSLSHRGWRATEVRLPTLAEQHDATVLAQAEVEL